MPKGVPKAGFRMTRKRMESMGMQAPQSRPSFSYHQPEPVTPSKLETDDEIIERIGERFDVLNTLIDGVIEGDITSLIISGPAGVGKSHSVETKLDDAKYNNYNYSIAKGKVLATGLFKQLWAYRESGQILIFDDADSVFFDDVSLNILKAALDTKKRRSISWLTEATLIDDETQTKIPRQFDYEGSIIFISNYDFDTMIEKGSKLAPHLQALLSRSQYIDLGMKTKRDCYLRVRQVIEGKATFNGMHKDEYTDVLGFIESHLDNLREISIRTALKIATIKRQTPSRWQSIAKITQCKK